MERQLASSLAGIAPDHLARYYFAKEYLSGRVLDAACGCGYGSYILNSQCVVTGVDICPEAIEHAKEHFPGPEYVTGDISQAPWKGRFSGVVSFETLEHLEFPEIVLCHFRQALNGLLICSVPNEDHYPFNAETFKNDIYPHKRHYTPTEFDKLVSENGFEVLSRWCQQDKRNATVKKGTEGRFLVYVCK